MSDATAEATEGVEADAGIGEWSGTSLAELFGTRGGAGSPLSLEVDAWSMSLIRRAQVGAWLDCRSQRRFVREGRRNEVFIIAT